MAKNLVAAGVSDKLEIQLSYAIGVPRPLSISVSTCGTAHYSDDVILEAAERFFDARPGAIIAKFGMTTPTWRYRDTCNYGVYGRPDLDLPWERLDKVEEIRAFLAKK
jgi:S-adenosylmethionine synthetase